MTRSVYRTENEWDEPLVVAQVLVRTWSRPTFLSFGTVGRIYAGGLAVGDDGEVDEALDDDLWPFR